MSLKGRGQGVDLGTSTLSLMRSIIFSFFGRALPYDPLNLFPFFVFLSPRPHNAGNAPPVEGDDAGVRACLSAAMNHLAVAATPHRCIIPVAIHLLCCLLALRSMAPGYTLQQKAQSGKILFTILWAGLNFSPVLFKLKSLGFL